MVDLAPYQLAMQGATPSVLAAVARGVLAGVLPPLTQAGSLLAQTPAPQDGVIRDADGRVLVTCVTDMPRVTPAMIDWWFGWHLPSSERYRLWHPHAHVAARVKEDRSHWLDDKLKYLNNVSYVDEYIGGKLMKLAIAFVPPEDFGIKDPSANGATAICAWTTDRVLGGRGGCLVHYVIPTRLGVQMRSAFWLGEIKHTVRPIGLLLDGLLNTAVLRKQLVPDDLALNLLTHCSEEMNHLARFLPELYAQASAPQ